MIMCKVDKNKVKQEVVTISSKVYNLSYTLIAFRKLKIQGQKCHTQKSKVSGLCLILSTLKISFNQKAFQTYELEIQGGVDFHTFSFFLFKPFLQLGGHRKFSLEDSMDLIKDIILATDLPHHLPILKEINRHRCKGHMSLDRMQFYMFLNILSIHSL